MYWVSVHIMLNVLKQDPPVTKLVTCHFVCLWLIEIRHFKFVLKKESGYNLSCSLYRNLKQKPPFWLETLDVSTYFTRVILFVISDQNFDSVLIMSRKPGKKNPNSFPYCIKAKFLYFLHLKSDQIKYINFIMSNSP